MNEIKISDKIKTNVKSDKIIKNSNCQSKEHTVPWTENIYSSNEARNTVIGTHNPLVKLSRL